MELCPCASSQATPVWPSGSEYFAVRYAAKPFDFTAARSASVTANCACSRKRAASASVMVGAGGGIGGGLGLPDGGVDDVPPPQAVSAIAPSATATPAPRASP